MLDLRLSIGWYFIVNSALLVIAAAVSGPVSMVSFHHQLLNLNFVWGAVLGMFGLLMVGLSYSEKNKSLSPRTELSGELRKLDIRQTSPVEKSAISLGRR